MGGCVWLAVARISSHSRGRMAVCHSDVIAHGEGSEPLRRVRNRPNHRFSKQNANYVPRNNICF